MFTYQISRLTRSHLHQKEIEVLLHEIFIPILEMKTSTLKQKAVILNMLQRLCQDPQALVELYLNYDCDGDAVDNIYEQCVVFPFYSLGIDGHIVLVSLTLSPSLAQHQSLIRRPRRMIPQVPGCLQTLKDIRAR